MPNLNEQTWLNMYQCVSALILRLLLPNNFLVNVVASSRRQRNHVLVLTKL